MAGIRGNIPLLIMLAAFMAGSLSAQNNSSALEDSIRREIGFKDSIQVLATSYNGHSHVYEFIDFNRTSIFHDQLVKYRVPALKPGSTAYKSYIETYKYLKLDSLRKTVKKQMVEKSLRGTWVPVYKYDGRFYLFMDSEFQRSFRVNDSTIIFNEMDGPYPHLIAGQGRDVITTLPFSGNELVPFVMVFSVADATLSVYQVSYGTNCSYYIRLNNIHNLPIIVQHSHGENESLVEFEKVDCQ
jgi:hypothetical protein